MPSYSPQDVQDELLKVIRTSQETVVEAVKTWVDAVKAVTPKVPTPQLPLAEKLPTPQDIVTSAYDFAEKLLSSQRQFAQELVAATAPLRPGSDAHEEQAAAAE
jgi:hypothetical protein